LASVAVIGLGSIGQRHVRNLHALSPDTHVRAYRTRRHPLPESLRGKWLTEHESLDEVLAARPQAALICNPTSLHLPLALAAARAGCHLLLEKPVSHSLEGLDELSQVVRQQRLTVLVGFQFRFHPGLQRVKQLLEEGAIGAVVHAHAHWGEYLPAWHPWEDYRQGYSARADLGGGVILTLCHPLDYLRWLIGEVHTVSAVAGQRSGLDLDVEDTADITMQFANGAVATVHLDYVQRPPAHHLEIVGQEGTIRWDNAGGTVHCFRAAKGDWETTSVPEGFERNTMFLDEMRHFLACVAGEEEPIVTLADGIRTLEVALAAKQSAAEGSSAEV